LSKEKERWKRKYKQRKICRGRHRSLVVCYNKKKYKISKILMSIVIKRSIMVHVLMKIVSKASK
jgi:hypothetical protein